MELGDLNIDPDLYGDLDGLANSLTASDEQFLIIEASTKGDASNPFMSPSFRMGTEDDLQAMYEGSNQLQETFGSFDNYLAYNRDFTAQGLNWIESAQQVEYRPGTPEWAYVNGEDLAWAPGQKEQIAQQVIDDQKNAFRSAYQQWVMSPEGSSLLSQYGINPTVYNNDGDQFRFTGTGFQKSYKVDDSFDVNGFVKGMITSVAVAGLTGNLAAALNIYAGVPASVAQNIANGVQAVATNGGNLSVGDFLSMGAQMAGLDIPPELSGDEWVNYVQSNVIDSAIDSAAQTVRDEQGVDVAWQDIDVTDELGVLQPQIPDYSNPVDGDVASSPEEPVSNEPSADEGVNNPAEIGDPRYEYGNGMWTDLITGELIYGPGRDGQTMTEDEMAGAWESGDYSWGDIADVSNPPTEDVADNETVFPIPDWTFGGSTPTVNQGGNAGNSENPDGDNNSDVDQGTDGGTVVDGGTDNGTDGIGDDPNGTGEDGNGNDDGDQQVASSGSGMLSGALSDSSPVWSDLFPYTTLKAPQKAALKPYVDYIKQARGMLS